MRRVRLRSVLKLKRPVAVVADKGVFLHELQRLYPATRYALAVSGGGDSMGMLGLAAQTRSLVDFVVLTVDHGLRAGSRAETEHVAQSCVRLELPYVILRPPAGIIPSESRIQATARTFRYRVMGDWCAAHTVRALVLAHHIEDQAETVLMRLARGSGLDGLCAMTPQSVRSSTEAGKQNTLILLRPFLDTPRGVLRAQAEAQGLQPIEDPSNHDSKYERVRLRAATDTLTTLGLTPSMLARSAHHLTRARAALDAYAHEILASAHLSPYGYVRLNRTLLRTHPDESARRALIMILRFMGQRATETSARDGDTYPPPSDKIDRLLAHLKSNALTACTLQGCLIRARQTHILIGREVSALPPPLDITGGTTLIWDGRFVVHTKIDGRLASLGRTTYLQYRRAARSRHLPANDTLARTLVRGQGGVGTTPAAYLYALPHFTTAQGALSPILPAIPAIGSIKVVTPDWHEPFQNK